MIYATGDTHGNFERFQPEYFPEQAEMTKEDYMIICGDFGGLWDGRKKDNRNLDWLESLPFTVLFVSGNHENFDLLGKYPVEEWNGGKVQRIRPHVIHLMRGQVFELQGYTFFTMGGARSHDMEYGVLNPYAPDFEEQYWTLRRMGASFRVNHRSWWKQELPTDTEIEEARVNLGSCDYKVDYVITHCASNIIQLKLEDIKRMQGRLHELYAQNILTDFFEELEGKLEYSMWYFGHYHEDMYVDTKHRLIYYDMEPVVGN